MEVIKTFEKGNTEYDAANGNSTVIGRVRANYDNLELGIVFLKHPRYEYTYKVDKWELDEILKEDDSIGSAFNCMLRRNNEIRKHTCKAYDHNLC